MNSILITTLLLSLSVLVKLSPIDITDIAQTSKLVHDFAVTIQSCPSDVYVPASVRSSVQQYTRLLKEYPTQVIELAFKFPRELSTDLREIGVIGETSCSTLKFLLEAEEISEEERNSGLYAILHRMLPNLWPKIQKLQKKIKRKLDAYEQMRTDILSFKTESNNMQTTLKVTTKEELEMLVDQQRRLFRMKGSLSNNAPIDAVDYYRKSIGTDQELSCLVNMILYPEAKHAHFRNWCFDGDSPVCEVSSEISSEVDTATRKRASAYLKLSTEALEIGNKYSEHLKTFIEKLIELLTKLNIFISSLDSKLRNLENFLKQPRNSLSQSSKPITTEALDEFRQTLSIGKSIMEIKPGLD